MDNEGAAAEGGGADSEGGGDDGTALPKRDGKQVDLLLEVESLEPKQLMSVSLSNGSICLG